VQEGEKKESVALTNKDHIRGEVCCGRSFGENSLDSGSLHGGGKIISRADQAPQTVDWVRRLTGGGILVANQTRHLSLSGKRENMEPKEGKGDWTVKLLPRQTPLQNMVRKGGDEL